MSDYLQDLPRFTAVSAFKDNVVPALWQWQQQGIKTALLTLVNIEGNGPRPVGSQLAVNAQGEYVGLISGGCVEPALVLEAQACIASQQARLIRYGKDSDYFDIQLPCGSGIDVLITPLTDTIPTKNLQHAYNNRDCVDWRFEWPNLHRITPALPSNARAKTPHNPNKTRVDFHQNFTHFSKRYTPQHRLVVVGKGSVFDYFLQMSAPFDVEVIAYSSEYSTVVYEGHVKKLPLQRVTSLREELLDTHSSVIVLSHDHTLDVPLLSKALRSPAHYIAAMGSRKTHEQRKHLLRDEGFTEEDLKKIAGPAGVNIGSSTPPEIALAILAEWIAQLRSTPQTRA